MNAPLTQPVKTSDRPYPERIRRAYLAWVKADADARLARDMKTTALEEYKQRLIEREGDMPDSHAERRIKSNGEWRAYIQSMVDLQTKANQIKADWQYLRDEFQRQQGIEASHRQEMRMTR